MADLFPNPRVSRSEQSTQLSYELSHRIYTVKSYPLQSVNGSTVLIYGQENGVKIVWRGGRQFKPPQEPSATKGKTNGTHDVVVLVDSDDDDTSSAPRFEDKPEFYAEEEEFDPQNPYPSILQVLDLYFGSDVLHLSVLPASVLRAEGVSWRGIAPLKQKIVFTAACADNKVRLVTLPLTPPSSTSKARLDFHSDFTTAHAGNGKWGETVVVLEGHQKPSHGVSMTVEASSSPEPSIVVASYSHEVNGLLRLHRIPIKSPMTSILPFQSIYLPTPVKRIAFNPSLSEPRNSHLLVADSTGVCRIYDYRILVKGQISDEPVDNPAAEQGSWLLSLYPGFEKDPHNGSHAGFGRKTIIDAKWVASGGAVVVLLNDGEWAIWDIEDAKPGASQGLLGRQAIKGGSRSGYSISGWIEGPVKKSSGPPQIASSKFAPMTPGARKNTDLFNGKSHSGASRGQISVLELPPTAPTSPTEESIVFWLGDSFALIPNLSKYWVAHGRKGGTLFNNTPSSRLIKLDGINLQGERCIGVEQIASRIQSGLPSEILVLGEHRFVVLTSSKATSQPVQSMNRLALAETNTTSTSGELDVIGIDQALSRMENGSTKRKLL